MEVTKTQFLSQEQFPFLIHNQKAVPSDPPPTVDTTTADRLWGKVRFFGGGVEMITYEKDSCK